MSSDMDFYKEKGDQLPRLLYRKIAAAAKHDSQADLVLIAKKFIEQTKSPDYLKFTWVLPSYLRKTVDPGRLEQLETFIEQQRRRRPGKLVEAVFPHVVDEFSLTPSFLAEVFDRTRIPGIRPDDVIYTIGSCFARNFSRYLQAKGLACSNFGQAEDLNSPGSNMLLLQYACGIDEVQNQDRLRREIHRIWSGIDEPVVLKMAEEHIAQLLGLKHALSKASKVIVTLGNTVDFYQDDRNGGQELAPKFLAMSPSEDVRVRDSIASRLAKLGTTIRLSTCAEVSVSIRAIYDCIRQMNKGCDIIFTVSPVPIDSVLGMAGTKLRAVEIDCVSKSTIRAALHEVMQANHERQMTGVHYLPSFEIVRWLAPLARVQPFGNEDAASRHVSNEVLNAVCEFAYRDETLP